MADPALHFDLDGAWAVSPRDLPVIDLRDWGPRLRFTCSPRAIESFFREIESRLGDFILYGSGDFHHLSALWLRRLHEPFTLICFDNHPDWDVRPPRWSCGGWINRALELPLVKCAVVWGCANFECWWPHQIFGNRKAERAVKLVIHPWADDRPEKARARRGAILRENWREHFEDFANHLTGESVYVTIDLDCLASGLAWTNWENGRLTYEDVQWALAILRHHAHIVGGDLCGAFSEPRFARAKQRFAWEIDHPKINLPGLETIRAVNAAALAALWPSLTQGHKNYAGADQTGAE
jgi:arginase family enzyme